MCDVDLYSIQFTCFRLAARGSITSYQKDANTVVPPEQVLFFKPIRTHWSVATEQTANNKAKFDEKLFPATTTCWSLEPQY